MMNVTQAETQIIYKDPYSYCAHPHIATLATGDWLLVFNRTVRRSYILHPPEDPHYYNVLMRSRDLGRSWNTPRVVPGYDWYGVECAGLTVLNRGTVLLNQWRFRWYTLEETRVLTPAQQLSYPQDWIEEMNNSGELETGKVLPDNPNEIAPWARGNGGTYVHRSDDGGLTWPETVEINTGPYSGGYGMRGAVELPDGEILLPLSDVPNYQTVFIARSSDGGRTWGNLTEAASLENCWFEEPSALVLPDGKIQMMLRENQSHYLYQTFSTDGGWTWSIPAATPIWGYPAHLLALRDGRILCVYGYRAQPYGIRAVLSYDQGQTWDAEHIWTIRDDLPNRDLGYPSSVLMPDDQIFTVYYAQDTDGVTCIQGTRYSISG